MEIKLKKELLIHIYNNYRKTMLYIANDILHDYQKSEDVVQDCIVSFESKYELLANLSEKELSLYISRTAKNKAINYYRKNTKVITVDFSIDEIQLIDTEYDISLRLLEEEFILDAKDYLLKVSKQQAEVFMYRFYYDYNNRQIAELLEISHINVRVLISRARKNLKDFIEMRRAYEQKNIR